MIRRLPWLLTAALANAVIPAAPAADDPEALAFFETKIRPVFAEKCYRCHSAEAEKLKAGLQVDHVEHLLKGGDTGPAIVAGKPEESFLVETIRYGDPDFQMPPKGKLDKAVIADFEKWIAMGAPWPDEPKPERSNAGVKVDGSDAVVEAFDLEKRRSTHWCWQPIQRPGLPAVKQSDWPIAALDHYILASLEAADLTPADRADPGVWLRRVSFDLIGLPPTPAQIGAFLAMRKAHSNSDFAEQTVVDQLLASPHYGERWARHWMDLARFGETCGHEFDYPIPNAYRYRDYLIDAFNADLPYDQFLTEHLAGDLLETPRLDPGDGTNESVVATGFWFLHEAVHAPTDIRGDEAGRIDNQIDVFSKSFLGLTVACARCHDHKFDAIGTADYYAMAGYLQSSRRQEAFLDPHGKVAAAETEARAIHQRGQAALPEAFGTEAENKKAAETFSRYLLAADRLVTENTKIEIPLPALDVFADFEDGYGEWKIEGEAFGKKPASGAFAPNQKLDGFLGKGLVNTWGKSDKLTGRALSPEFTIGQKFIHFLIAGGKHPEQTCINLLVDGKVVETATGQNNDSLAKHTWPVEAYLGKKARIEIVDQATGGWGHIDVDHIVFCDLEALDLKDKTRPIDPTLLTRIATEEGSLDETTLLNWAELLRRDDLKDSQHPLHDWKKGASRNLDQTRAIFEEGRAKAEVLASFENGDAEGWTVTGNAFDSSPSKTASWAPGANGALVSPANTISTANVGEEFHGVLRSPTFELTHDHIHLRLNARLAKVRLVIDGHYMNHFHQLLLRGTLLRSSQTDTEGEFRWLTMRGNLDKYLGHRVWIEISDLEGGFVALDEVLLSNEDLPPEPDALVSLLSGITKANLAQSYGDAWARSLAGLRSGNPAASHLPLINLAWRHQLWPQNETLHKARIAMAKVEVPSPIYATALLDGTPENEHIHIRGSHQKLGEPVPRRNLDAFGGTPAPADSSGRLQLAQQLTGDANPLVRRVIVNRVWHQLFGRGIVPTVDDFGVMGQPPSHPELLDQLAADFSDQQGWSIKQLLREIVLSQTYRMSSTPHPSLDADVLAVVDPENRLLHCAPVRRLQAEAVRDAILTVSGRLDPIIGGPSVPVHLTSFMEGRGRPGQSGPLDGNGRRSLYTEIRRNFLPPFLLTFDMPIPFNAMGRRSVSNVPAQALSLMNDPFVISQAKLWAERVSSDASRTDAEKIAELFQSAFARKPSDIELGQIETFLASEPDEKQAWSDLCHALFNKKEFIYLN